MTVTGSYRKPHSSGSIGALITRSLISSSPWASHIVSPNPSKTPSIVSVDSILQDKPDTSPVVQGAPDAAGVMDYEHGFPSDWTKRNY